MNDSHYSLGMYKERTGARSLDQVLSVPLIFSLQC
uniref:Uncharacterized protein n=1 Tax=Arundo donax TaxID=35708 RepID=A0A0A9CHR6_ARUDO